MFFITKLNLSDIEQQAPQERKNSVMPRILQESI